MLFMRFVWMPEQTADFALCSTNIDFYNRGGDSSLRGTHRDLIQGESLARGPKLLSIKNYVIEIMT